ncbi:MAG: hypothetical protein JHC26_13135 [Thermofilum sp.]|uniref:hypothetical protein n=1 Tax=Thermofilum sp. TaxID=1961369 RepID=UPI00258F0059|nr:hypothetical protein [Thermofilum sp.]MCI4410029.1 hypothetical protein [Thermofilum sp.]
MIKIVNLMPNPIHVLNEEGFTVEILKPCNKRPFVTDTQKVKGLPEPSDGVCYLTTEFIASLAKRKDVVAPNEDLGVVRIKGKIVAINGVKTFA